MLMLPGDQSSSPKGQRHRLVALRQGAMVLLVTTALGLFFAAQIRFSAASVQREVSWGQALYWSFGDWYEWALLAPFIFWICQRFRFERHAWLGSLTVHLFAGLLLAGVHAAMCAGADVLQGWVTAKPIAFAKSLRGILA